MTESLVAKLKRHWNIILGSFLWLCIWATYDTDISRLWTPGFPHSMLDLIHGLRSLLPFLALVASIFVLIKKRSLSKKIFLTPLGLLSIFTAVGIFSSIFSNNHLMAFYWGALYGTVLIFLLAFIGNKDLLKKVIKINWLIAGVLALGLTAFFLVQPGVVKSLTYNFLICAQRPYEGLANIGAAVNTFDIAGTRPTGLGRYAGIIAIVALVGFFYGRKKIKAAWGLSFVIFLGILLFSKGKTEILAFILAMIFVIWLAKKVNMFSVIAVCAVSLLSLLVIFYNIPCTNSLNYLSYFIPHSISTGVNGTSSQKNNYNLKINSAPVPQGGSSNISSASAVKARNAESIITLSGRTSGVWSDAWHLFLKNPLVGFGFQADRFFLSGQHAHDSILHALIQAGVIGTIPFLLAFALTLIILLRLFRNPQVTGEERNFLVTVSAVMVFFAVRSITESVAFFSADWLFVAPMIAYIQCLDSRVSAGSNPKNLVMNFLGNKINLADTSEVVDKICYWIKNESQKMHWVIVTGMHGIVEAEKHISFKYILSSANLWVPDGISLVWLAKLKGFNINSRVSGADLMTEFFKSAGKKGFSSYFYGDTEETLEALNKKLSSDFPGLKIAGSYSPPFRKLTEEEDAKIIEKINQAKPDVLWVALGLPKQEKWIFEHREKLNVPVVIGVGAAFKFLSGKVKRAPAWVGNLGFEWLWRLIKEPKVTWKRVFIDMPIFFWLVAKDFLFENNSKI